MSLKDARIGFVGGGIPSVPANILLLKNIHVAGFNMGQHVGWGVKDERVSEEL